MKTGTLFRVGLYLIAVWAVFTALTMGSYQVVFFIKEFDRGVSFFLQAYLPATLCYFVLPLGFAGIIFVAADRIQRALLGARSEEAVAGVAVDSQGLLVVALKVLGCYLFINYGTALLSTIMELFAWRIHNNAGPESRLVGNLVVNGVGVVAGCWLVAKTDRVVGRIQ